MLQQCAICAPPPARACCSVLRCCPACLLLLQLLDLPELPLPTVQQMMIFRWGACCAVPGWAVAALC